MGQSDQSRLAATGAWRAFLWPYMVTYIRRTKDLRVTDENERHIGAVAHPAGCRNGDAATIDASDPPSGTRSVRCSLRPAARAPSSSSCQQQRRDRADPISGWEADAQADRQDRHGDEGRHHTPGQQHRTLSLDRFRPETNDASELRRPHLRRPLLNRLKHETCRGDGAGPMRGRGVAPETRFGWPLALQLHASNPVGELRRPHIRAMAASCLGPEAPQEEHRHLRLSFVFLISPDVDYSPRASKVSRGRG